MSDPTQPHPAAVRAAEKVLSSIDWDWEEPPEDLEAAQIIDAEYRPVLERLETLGNALYLVTHADTLETARHIARAALKRAGGE